jgi:hypothetical protein
MNRLAFQLPRMMSLDFSIGRGSGTVIIGRIKENECDRIGLIVLNEKWVNSKKKNMSRGIARVKEMCRTRIEEEQHDRQSRRRAE